MNSISQAQQRERSARSPLWAMIREHWDLGLFLLGIVGAIFAFGVTVGKGRAFPHAQIDHAIDAARDWKQHWRHYLGIRNQYLMATQRTTGGVTRYDRAAAWPGYTFMTMYRDGRFGASLVDMEGRTVHRWDTAFSEVWPNQSHLELTPRDDDLSIHGAELLPNGDVILNLMGAGTVRLDRCSNVVWKVSAETHHSIDYLPNGDTIIPGRHRRYAPMASYPRMAPGREGFFWEETLLRVRPDGSIAQEVPILEMIYKGGWQSLLFSPAQSEPTVDIATHHNDAEVLRDDMAAAFPMFKAGDIMLSLRNINTIIVVDPHSWAIKWKQTGPFLGQHDPDFLPNGHILVFDNQAAGAKPIFGQSRVLEIDPATHGIVWSFQGTDAEPFYATERGMVQALPNGNVLVSEPDNGRAFEISRQGGNHIVWDYTNLAQPGFVGLLTQAERVDPAKLSFLGGSCAAGDQPSASTAPVAPPVPLKS